jgi:hypothetical protein
MDQAYRDKNKAEEELQSLMGENRAAIEWEQERERRETEERNRRRIADA